MSCVGNPELRVEAAHKVLPGQVVDGPADRDHRNGELHLDREAVEQPGQGDADEARLIAAVKAESTRLNGEAKAESVRLLEEAQVEAELPAPVSAQLELEFWPVSRAIQKSQFLPLPLLDLRPHRWVHIVQNEIDVRGAVEEVSARRIDPEMMQGDDSLRAELEDGRAGASALGIALMPHIGIRSATAFHEWTVDGAIRDRHLLGLAGRVLDDQELLVIRRVSGLELERRSADALRQPYD